MKQLSKGFTLIELMVVIAIIALIASLVLTSTAKSRAKGRTAFKTAQVREYQKALELYRSSNSGYPNYGSISGISYGCLGYAVGSGCIGFTSTNAQGITALNSALSTYIPGPPANMDSIIVAASEFRGIGYACLTASGGVCTQYQMEWYLEGGTQQCAGGRANGSVGINTWCVYP